VVFPLALLISGWHDCRYERRSPTSSATPLNRLVSTLLRPLVIAVGTIACLGTLLSLTRSSHWSVRAWDFPRVQIAAAAGLSGALFRLLFFRGRLADVLFVLANAACVLWQGRKIRPYTRLSQRQVKRGRIRDSKDQSFRLLITNVQMENKSADRLLRLIDEYQPDLIMAVETDEQWVRALAPLGSEYPYSLKHPQDNYYGLVLLSRFPLVQPRIEFLVQDDVPSVHTEFVLPGGQSIVLHGLHPRPPEPLRDMSSTPRDAELVAVGRAIGEADDRPTIVAGDLNDVAWSPTSELFLRLSGLLDPRIGRGFYNSFNANNPLLRYPLDHVFHSNHFKLLDLRRLPHIGSDHFPMFVELLYDPAAAKPAQPKTESEPGDDEQADEKLNKQSEAARTGDDRPNDG
jgi:endonuclease/exonuclease/phosphatase (EEP) superfamily protein YafD